MSGEDARLFWVLSYDYGDDYLERRAPFRDAHLAVAEAAHRRDDLVLAGAVGDPVDGALLVFRADDVSVVEDFVRADPYVEHGVVLAWRIRRWNVVVGGEASRRRTR